MDKVSRVMSGTWGEMWLDDQYVGECYGLQAKLAYTRETIQQCRKLMPGKKLMSMEGTGSVKLHKVSSRMIEAVAARIKEGIDPRFTIISKLDDPDAYGAERIILRGVAFDDTTLADWEVGSVGKTENPFTFEDWEPVDTVEAR